MRSEVNKTIEFGRLQCWYYWGRDLKYTVEIVWCTYQVKGGCTNGHTGSWSHKHVCISFKIRKVSKKKWKWSHVNSRCCPCICVEGLIKTTHMHTLARLWAGFKPRISQIWNSSTTVHSPSGIYSLPPVLIQLVFPLRISLQTPAEAGSPLADFSTLKMEGIRFSESSVYAPSTQRHIPEDGIVHSHRCENLKSYTVVPVTPQQHEVLYDIKRYLQKDISKG
jgi:hypothetical protein